MKKTIKTILLSLGLLITPVSLMGCTFFNTNDSVVNIKNIDVKKDQDGNTIITIYYTDVNSEPTTFTIPIGDDGKEGNGIKNIEYTPLEDDSGTTITIHFTDESKEPVSFVVKNGEGKKGDDGAGIFELTSERDEENKRTVITITFTDDRDPVTLYIPDGEKGEQGNSVRTITQTLSSDGTKYIVTFLDDFGDVISSIELPRANSWLSGTTTPSDENGNDGDFYFETTHYYVYQKVGGKWNKVAELGAAKENEKTHQVTFDVNDSVTENALIVSGQKIYTITEGMNFYSSGFELPMAYRQGYTFSGWITSKTYNVTLGLFTNLTEVYKDMTLYAYWTKQ